MLTNTAVVLVILSTVIMISLRAAQLFVTINHHSAEPGAYQFNGNLPQPVEKSILAPIFCSYKTGLVAHICVFSISHIEQLNF